MADESHALVRLSVGTGGELELVMSREIWEALKSAMKEEEAAAATAAPAAGTEPVVRVSLKRMTMNAANLNLMAPPLADQPPCPPVGFNAFNTFTVSATPGTDMPPCPPVTI